MNNIFDYYDKMLEETNTLTELIAELNKKKSSLLKTYKKIVFKSKNEYVRSHISEGKTYKIKEKVPAVFNYTHDDISIIIVEKRHKCVRVVVCKNDTREDKVFEYYQLFTALGFDKEDAIAEYRTFLTRNKILSQLLD